MRTTLFHLLAEADTVIVDDQVIDEVGYSDNFMPGPPVTLARLTIDDTDYHFADQEVEVVNGYASAMAMTWDESGDVLETEEVKVSMAFKVERMLELEGPKTAFSTQLFTALHACDPGSALIYDEGHELVSTDEIRYASGDGVMIEFSDGEEYLFLDQEVLVDSGGCCPVSDAEGRQFYFTLQVARPLTEADLEPKP